MKNSTTNYKMFTVHESNVVYDQSNLKKLEASIQARDMLQHKPIIIDGQNRVIDGKHRLKVAEKLGLPIWYTIDIEAQDEDIILLNTAGRQWKSLDYLEYYASKGKIEYVTLKNFLQEKKITFTQSLGLLRQFSCKSEFLVQFKTGKFVMEKYCSITNMSEILIQSQVIIKTLKEIIPHPNAWLLSSRLAEAIMFLQIKEGFDMETFIGKINYNTHKIRPAASREQYIAMFQVIYNWKNQNPI